MFSLVHSGSSWNAVAREAPALAGALLIAELFYKFHSFSLECVAFLATWYVLGGVTRLALGR